jgi:hypothetical protein
VTAASDARGEGESKVLIPLWKPLLLRYEEYPDKNIL